MKKIQLLFSWTWKVTLSGLLLTVVAACSRDDDVFIEPEPEPVPVVVDDDEPEPPADSDPIEVSPYFSDYLMIAHRGLPDYPENTFVSVDAAVASGYRAVECDICKTKDDVFVLSHDMTIDRCSNGTGRVDEMTYEQLLAYDFGSWMGERFVGVKITRLDELLDYFREKQLIIELDLADETRFKREWLPQLYELVRQKGMLGQTLFTATQDEFADFLAEKRQMVISVSGVNGYAAAQRALPLKDQVTLCCFSMHYNDLSLTVSELAHDHGMKVKCWTVETQWQLEKCVSMQVDYIITKLPYRPWPWLE